MFIIIDYKNGKADGHLRLADGGVNYGRLEIAVNGYWGTVCSDGFTKTAADVACKELGFGKSLRFMRK